MAKGVLIHNPGTSYKDDVATRYHFPKMYLDRIRPFIGDRILYYQSGAKGGYTGTAQILSIEQDPEMQNHYFANIAPRCYIGFSNNVPFRIQGQIANQFLANPDGSPNRGRQVWAVRQISDADFMKIISLAAVQPEELPRISENQFEEKGQEPFIFDAHRSTIEVVLNKKVRDRLFREQILTAYNKTCAFTGMRFINGGGRAEVQAAHIKAVANDGPDLLSNGIALSGTIHWMFDRGLLALSDDYKILVSRKVNNISEVDRLLVRDRQALLPENQNHHPDKRYIAWHREHHEFQAA